MKLLSLSVLALVSSVVVASAESTPGGLFAARAATASGTSFAGAYGGLELGTASSSGGLSAGVAVGAPASFPDGTTGGLFVGYNFQNGNFVYGGELRYVSLRDMGSLTLGNFEMDDVLDVRGRVGVVSGAFLFYGALGWSEVSTSVTTSGASGDLDGLNYGLGVEYSIDSRFSVGLDYAYRDVDGNLTPGAIYDGDLETVSIRFAMRF
jgi:opacity protein-like surface antigen